MAASPLREPLVRREGEEGDKLLLAGGLLLLLLLLLLDPDFVGEDLGTGESPLALPDTLEGEELLGTLLAGDGFALRCGEVAAGEVATAAKETDPSPSSKSLDFSSWSLGAFSSSSSSSPSSPLSSSTDDFSLLLCSSLLLIGYHHRRLSKTSSSCSIVIGAPSMNPSTPTEDPTPPLSALSSSSASFSEASKQVGMESPVANFREYKYSLSPVR